MKNFTLILLIFFVPLQNYASSIYKVITEDGKVVYTNRKNNDRPKPQKTQNIIDESIYSPYLEYINKFSERYSIDKDLILSIIFVESFFNEKAVSHKGASGLMQLMPATARRFNVTDIFDPKENIRGGTEYLRYLFDFFEGNLDFILAAYNAGENNVLRYNGIPPFRETQNYVKRVNSVRGALSSNVIFVYTDKNGNQAFTNNIDAIPAGSDYRIFRNNN